MEESAVTGSRRVGGNAGPSRTGISWRERGSASDQLRKRGKVKELKALRHMRVDRMGRRQRSQGS